ncbi:MAG: hypothetical protein JXQ27_05175 [Acidobacteria bacterium]|nr:hypothetical protein [Acidobacteriota bacterium]
MHHGCNGTFEDGRQVIRKLRLMGFAGHYLPVPFTIVCRECGQSFEMVTFEDHCPHCRMVYGVTPCHAFDPANVMAAGREE